MDTKRAALPWFPVPPYGRKGFESQWHILDINGELVGVFEEQDDCEFVCSVVNDLLVEKAAREAKA